MAKTGKQQLAHSHVHKILPELKANILLVDDEPANLLAIRAILEDLGQNLVEAHSGEEALRRVLEAEFAVVLLDIQMPTLNGFETAKRIREQEQNRHTPIMFLATHESDRATLERAYSLGAVDYLVKPLVPIILKAKVAGLVELFQAKARAKREADQFRLLIQGTTEYAIFMLDADGHVLTWNPGAERIKGYRAEEIIGRHFSQFYPQETLQRGWPAHELEVARTEGRFEDEGWRVRKDGTQFWANVVITALHDETGNHQGFSKITRDMTDRKQAEESARRLLQEETARRTAEEDAGILQEQRERLHVTLSSIGDAVISTDAQGGVTFLNPVAQALTGWTSDEAQGKPLTEVFRIVNEQTRLPVENPALRAVQEGVIVGLANHTLLIAKDGVERPIDDSAAPIRDPQGKVVGAVLVFRDITERKQAETAIRESEARKAAILQTALDCIITMDHEGKVVEFNPAAEKTFGYNRDEVVGWALADLIIPPSLRDRHHQGLAHYLATGEGPVLNKRIELPALHADGTEFPIELAITRISTAGPPVFTAYLREIGERTRIEARRRARLAVTQILAEATTVRGAAARLLQAICENLGWDVGLFWTVDEAAKTLHCSESWHRSGTSVEEFEATSRQRSFVSGEGLPGRVWATRKPVWIPNVEQDGNFPRIAIAAKEGIRGAFACPVVVGGETLGVIEFFSRRIQEPDAGLLEMMDTIGGQIGQFMERKQAEGQLRQSEQELADFFENASVGLHWVGPDGIILRVNQAELDMLGYRREEYVGRPIAEFHADEKVICDILERLQAGEKLSEYPARLKCKDGSLKDVLIDSSVLFRDGVFVHTRCFTRNVTNLKRSEQTARFLAEASHTLAGLVDYHSTLQKVASLAVPYFADWATVDILESDGALRRLAVAHIDPTKIDLAHELNRRNPPDPAAPRGIWNIVRTGRSEIVPEITDALLVETIEDQELLGIIRELGLKSYLSVPLNVRGKTLGVISFIAAESGHRYDDSDLAVAEDLAHRAAIAIENTQLYRELRQADQRKDEFLATLAHELRNPLAPIRNALEVMRLAGNSADAVEQSRRMMERQVVQMVRLVDDLLDVSRITRNKLELRKERIELASVVRSAIETSRPFIEQSDHTLTVTLPPEPIYLDADPTRLEQVFSNLLNNSAKYTERGGHIWLTVEPGEGKVLVRVRDSGIGIPAEALAGIFEMFSQVEGNLERAQGGLGIGLTLVRRLVEMHGGSVEAHSAGRGHGSEFLVRLPMAPAPGRAEQQANGGDEQTIVPKRRILVVDDNRDSATSLSLMLSILGNEIRTAHDGLEAVQAAAAFRPDVILLDIGLPKLNGYDACRRIREQPWGREMVIVALTGWGQEDDRRRSQEAGFNHHLVKPVDPTILKKLLTEMQS